MEDLEKRAQELVLEEQKNRESSIQITDKCNSNYDIQVTMGLRMWCSFIER